MDQHTKRHRRIYRLVCPLLRVWLRRFAGYQPGPVQTLPGPFLVISNHVTDYDQFVVSTSFREHLYYVIGEHTFRGGLVSQLMRRYFDPIPRFKATTAVSTVREMLRRLRRGHSICIFAEGSCSHNGLPNPIPPGTGNLVRKMNCTLVTFRIEGGYFTQPRWAKYRRKGQLSGHTMGVYPPRQLREMSVEEVNALIARDIGEDAYAANAVSRIPYRGKALAEGLEFELVLCPHCGALHSIQTQDDRFFCACGLKGTYDVYGLLAGEGFSFTTVTQWDIWQRQQIAALPEYPVETVLCTDPEQILTEVFPDHTSRELGRGALQLTDRALSVGEHRFPLTALEHVDIFRHGYLLLETRDKQYLEIRGENKYPGYLYTLLIQRYQRGN